ncbi:hypothetical protein HG537_0C03430 [Torulaspora globosa]|uniref:DNA polymerase n=1 Tax=Torulaspora globosa TaxID=48254 RepID=A0A7H9HTG2_9SACH|nr:hypothetical protein HG537_0C03430 [Torulaspora sp. CBS 2947]
MVLRRQQFSQYHLYSVSVTLERFNMGRQSDRLEKLKKLQAARNGLQLADDEEDDRLYDEIDENEYRNRKRHELLHDDFVVDDDGLGYVDRGAEEEHESYSEDEQLEDLGEKREMRKRHKEKTKIDNLIRVQQKKMSLSGRSDVSKSKNIAVDEFDDILGEFENDVVVKLKPSIRSKLPSSPTKIGLSVKRGGKGITDDGDDLKKRRIENGSSLIETVELDSSPIKPHKREHDDKIRKLDEQNSLMKSAEPVKASQDDAEVSDDSDDDITFGGRTLRSVVTSRKMNISSVSNPPSSPFVTAPSTPAVARTNLVRSALHSSPEPLTFGKSKCTKEQVVDADTDTFRMFWLDYCQVDNSLALFGKIKTKENSYVSGMVQIRNICRELYFLPREGKTPQDIHEEIVPLLLERYGLDNIRTKPEKMKYCFELPDIPRESEYLKVLLPFNTPKRKNEQIPADLSSDNFYHVFGGNSNIFECFAVQNKIMGPCWLEFKSGDFSALQNASNCALEVVVNKPQHVKPLDLKELPGLDAICLAMQTVMNVKENRQEIVAITLSTYKNLPLESPIPENLKPDEITTLVRPPQGSSFPVGLPHLTKEKLNGQVRQFNNEKTLLSCFCAMLKLSDPDVIIGHRLESIYLDVLAHRLHDLGIPTFNAIGRRVRKQWPERFGKNNATMNRFFVQELMAGRLVCDIANDMGQSLTPKCQNWELAEMYQVTCGVDRKPLDINYQHPQYQEDASSMTMALNENIENCLIAAEVSFRIQLLSLTKQLTNLAGNAWSQTLGGTRAGRNEYILLHEFARNGFIVPDKGSNKVKKTSRLKEAEDDSQSPNPVISAKKANFQGGLVFEPEKGLHKNYVLVMDFNSLYPSIIQEFNICFTTVERNLDDADELPDTPAETEQQGVLPRLLANLVQRRREVKRIMATESDPHKRAQCDIRQQALKLTANSMYGCLGYVNSRFYAKPLAMLVTNKGREILMNTRQLAEKMGLLVVYGDTDSVMIDSGCDNYSEALKIGNNFKQLINERYKLLEIDIDNVFKKLLLQAKKKYAALNVRIDKDGNEHTVLEVKGLDMRRREYCPLSRDVSVHVLNTIFSDKDPESALQDIYEYLEEITRKVQENKIRTDLFKINTKLSKDPSAYPAGKSSPAVQVALRMRKNGRVVKAGTVITFIITKQKPEDISPGEPSLSAAARARALNEVMIKGNNLQPDPEYYLEKQIFGPVQRLLETIESFDLVRLSTALGLDSRKYMTRDSNNNANGINGLEPLESTISDAERFKDVANFKLCCPNCSCSFDFGGIVASSDYTVCPNGLQCRKCDHLFTPLQISCQLERCIRSHISLYYAGWIECDDPTCGNATRQVSVFGKLCLNNGCTGVRYKYSDKMLYNQLLYFDSLFDCEKNKKLELKPLRHADNVHSATEKLSDASIKVLTEQNRQLLEINRSVVQKYLSDCGRRYVDMGCLFDFMQ